MAHINIDGSGLPDKMPLPPVNTPLAFQVVNIGEKESNAGKPMLEVTMELQDDACPDNNGDKYFDYFVELATSKKTQVKFNAGGHGRADWEEGQVRAPQRCVPRGGAAEGPGVRPLERRPAASVREERVAAALSSLSCVNNVARRKA
jgi:hypothetical protein